MLQRAGVVFRKRNAGKAWMGNTFGGDGGTRVGSLVAPGSPEYEAGLEQDDQITAIDGRAVASWAQLQDLLASHKPGDTVRVDFTRRSGAAGSGTITLKEDPSLEAVPVEDTGGGLTPQQKAFREAWLGAHAR
jgi:predicted metalloprotease with PDZ domain